MVLRPRNGLSLCAGGGGLDLGLMLAEPGFHTRCWVEWEEYPRSVIVAGQRAGYFAPAPIWDDLTTFDARPFAGCIDTLLAGYPCQPFSHAGQRKGADDERHLWPDVARVARELGPSLEWLLLENVAGHLTLGLETVLRDLWDMDFTPAVGLFTAAETGAPHERERVFIVAHRDVRGREPFSGNSGVCRTHYGTGEPAEQFSAIVDPMAHRSGAGCAQRGPVGQHQAVAQGENRLVAEPERRGGRPMDDTTGARRADAGRGADQRGDGHKGGQCLSGDGRDAMGHPARVGRGEGRAKPEVRSGRNAPASAGGTMADTERSAGHEGRASGRAGGAGPNGQASDRPRGRDVALFPPGPGDSAAWADTVAVAPDLAPATGIGDCLAWAGRLAQAVEVSEQAEIESALRRMADGLALRSRALRLLGNGVHPLAAGHAWRTLSAAHGLRPLDLVAAEGSHSNRANVISMIEAAE